MFRNLFYFIKRSRRRHTLRHIAYKNFSIKSLRRVELLISIQLTWKMNLFSVYTLSQWWIGIETVSVLLGALWRDCLLWRMLEIFLLNSLTFDLIWWKKIMRFWEYNFNLNFGQPEICLQDKWLKCKEVCNFIFKVEGQNILELMYQYSQ